MIKNLHRVGLIVVVLLNIFTAGAQFFPPKNYPQNYFVYPVQAKVSLSANFGELRPNHYHMGWDCRTDQSQNKPIVAAADGYVARVRIEPWGFGRSIYINHPNGLTTLYAHLNDFYPELESYVKEQQYKLKSWAVVLDIPESLFPVTKEMFIAHSGNTGGSQGPHLHFEIRDTKSDKVLNPSLFYSSIPDDIAPDVYRLAVYDRRFSTYEQTPKIIKLKKVNGVYITTPALLVVNTHKLSFGITAYDRFTGSGNRNGIYETVLYQNEVPVVGFQLDSISYDETRYLNAHIDYALKSRGGGYVQHVSKLPGFNNSVYKTTHSDGVINIDDSLVHAIKMEVKDANGNMSLIQFNVQRKPGYSAPPALTSINSDQQVFEPGNINLFENNHISFYLPENGLYDSIRFRYNEININSPFPIFQIHNTSVPVQSRFPVTIKASTPYPGKMVMHRFAAGKHDYLAALPVMQGKETGWFRAGFRDFGSFQLMIDTVPPVITPIGFKNGMTVGKQGRIVFSVKDNTEEIKKFTALLDGNWLRFTNDKASRFIYQLDEMCAGGEHELTIIAEDQVGNVSEKVYRFKRQLPPPAPFDGPGKEETKGPKAVIE